MSRIVCTAALSQGLVPVGLIATSILFTITDAAGANHAQSVAKGNWTTTETGMEAKATFNDGDVPVGDFSGTAQALTDEGDNVGDPVSFASPDNPQWTPSSVSVVLG